MAFSKKPGALFYETKTVEWWTPPKYIDLARKVMGGIDCDPASTVKANEIVKATTFYDSQSDGLSDVNEWKGRVWLNSPYGRVTRKFICKLITEWNCGNVKQAITLLSVNTVDRSWFKPLWNFPICFVYGRVCFLSPDEGTKIKKATSPPLGSLFVYIGNREERFAEVFGEIGAVLKKDHATCA